MKNFAAIRRVLLITMGLNLLATVIKLVIGYRTGSISVVANGFDSVFDSTSNVVGLVGIYLAAKPADEDHPYGHRKFETFAAVAIVILLFLTCWEVAESALGRLQSPVLISPTVNLWSFGALAFGTIISLLTSRYQLDAGRRLKSDVLVADALHTRTDVYVSLSVIGGLIAVRLGFLIVDPLLALGIAVVIAKTGLDIIRESSRTLLDRAAIPLSDIEAVARAVPGVATLHQVRSRGHEDDIHVDLHIQVEPDMPAAQAHTIAHKVQDRLMEDLAGVRDVVIHVEPQGGTRVSSTEEVSGVLRRLAGEQGLRIHDMRAYQLAGNLYADLHLEVPTSLTLHEAHRRSSALVEAAHETFSALQEMITHIEPAQSRRRVEEADQEEAEEVSRIVQQVVAEWCDSCHKVSVRRLPASDRAQTEDELTLSLHCQLDPDTSIENAHHRSQQVENALRARIPHLGRVIIHVEPMADGS